MRTRKKIMHIGIKGQLQWITHAHKHTEATIRERSQPASQPASKKARKQARKQAIRSSQGKGETNINMGQVSLLGMLQGKIKYTHQFWYRYGALWFSWQLRYHARLLQVVGALLMTIKCEASILLSLATKAKCKYRFDAESVHARG